MTSQATSVIDFDGFQEENIMKFRLLTILIPLLGVAASIHADHDPGTLVVTASNDASANQLLVYDDTGKLLQTVPTKGQGGVSGNAGGIEAKGNMLAVVNFGSMNVSILQLEGKAMHMEQLVPAVSSPVSVAFGRNHLYILGTTKVESHAIYGSHISASPDGVVSLLTGDGSAAQVGVVQDQLIMTEKSGAIETVNLLPEGAVSGIATLAQNIPANPLAPFGLVTRGDDAYVTIAHSNEITLVRNGSVLTVTGSGTQNSPCWLTLVGPFLYSSNSPSKSVSRYAVYGQRIVQDSEVAASFSGNPTDIASGEGLVAVIAGSGMSVFSVDEDGNLTLKNAITIPGTSNGVAVIGGSE